MFPSSSIILPYTLVPSKQASLRLACFTFSSSVCSVHSPWSIHVGFLGTFPRGLTDHSRTGQVVHTDQYGRAMVRQRKAPHTLSYWVHANKQLAHSMDVHSRPNLTTSTSVLPTPASASFGLQWSSQATTQAKPWNWPMDRHLPRTWKSSSALLAFGVDWMDTLRCAYI